MRKVVLKMWALIGVCLLAAPTAWASRICVVSDPDDGMTAFAVSDIEEAISSRGHTVVKTSSLQKVSSDAAVSIVLTVLDDQKGVSTFQAAGGVLPHGLKPEGFAIRFMQQGGQNTYYVLGCSAS